jgi:DNA-binding XRE family transcriptional regulator
LGLEVDLVGYFWFYLVMPEAHNGPAMKAAYESQGLTREQFAQRVGLSPQSITNIANGGVCSRPAAVRIARALGWTSEQHLFLREGPEAGPAAEAEATAATTPAAAAEAEVSGAA